MTRYRLIKLTFLITLSVFFCSRCVRSVGSRPSGISSRTANLPNEPIAPQGGNGGVYEAANVEDYWNLANPYCTDSLGVKHPGPDSTLSFQANGDIYMYGNSCASTSPTKVDPATVIFSLWDGEMSAKNGTLYVRRNPAGKNQDAQISSGIAFCTYGTSTNGFHTGLSLVSNSGYRAYFRASSPDVINIDPQYLEEPYFVPVLGGINSFMAEYSTPDGNARVQIFIPSQTSGITNGRKGQLVTRTANGEVLSYPLSCIYPPSAS